MTSRSHTNTVRRSLRASVGATVAGVGTLAAVNEDDTVWVEYGARVGYAVTENVTFDVFANGVSGEDQIDTRVHTGAGLRVRF